MEWLWSSIENMFPCVDLAFRFRSNCCWFWSRHPMRSSVGNECKSVYLWAHFRKNTASHSSSIFRELTELSQSAHHLCCLDSCIGMYPWALGHFLSMPASPGHQAFYWLSSCCCASQGFSCSLQEFQSSTKQKDFCHMHVSNHVHIKICHTRTSDYGWSMHNNF